MNNIKSSLFNITKEIMKSDDRKKVFEKMKFLRSDTETQGSIDYIAKKESLQFLGYLLIYNDRKKILENEMFKIPNLDDEILQIIKLAHNTLRVLCERCIEPLQKIFPKSYNTINPYWSYPNSSLFDSDEIISLESTDEFIKNFHDHPIFNLLEVKIKQISKITELEDRQFFESIFLFKQHISTFGLKNCPTDFRDLIRDINKSSSPKTTATLVYLALISLHSSLQNIYQLLYQAFTKDKLTVLNEDNVFAMLYYSPNVLSNIFELSSDEPIYDCGEIVLIDIPFEADGRKKKEFGVVETINLRFSQEYGEELDIGLRTINKNFSSYSNLEKTIFQKVV